MTTSLPEGIVTHTDSVAREIDQVDVITVDDVRRLWKVYNANKHVLRRNSGGRLENLFWRIWANQGRLCRELSGSTVAKLFVSISEDAEVLQTTPVPSPRTRLRHMHVSSDVVQQADRGVEHDARRDGEGAVASPQGSAGTDVPRQSTLRRRPGAVEQRATGDDEQMRVDASGVQNANGGEAAAASTSSPMGATPKSSTPPTSTRSPLGPKRKKPTFVAGPSNRARSAVLFRRKSSQSSSTAGTTSSSSIRSPQSPQTGDNARLERQPDVVSGSSSSGRSGRSSRSRLSDEQTSADLDGGRTPTAISEIDQTRPTRPWQQQKQQQQQQQEQNGSGGGAARRPSRPVQTFSSPALSAGAQEAERPGRRPDRLAAISTRPAASKTSATLAATPTAAIGTVAELPPVSTARKPSASGRDNVGGAGSARLGMIIVDEVVPLKPEGATTRSAGSGASLSKPAVSFAPATSIAVVDDGDDRGVEGEDEDDDDDDGAATLEKGRGGSRSAPRDNDARASNLPRTKSHLTLLLERDRQQIEVSRSRKKKGRKLSA
ncbi:MAG: hypothetical protein M1815_003438 [Lichina confinis]|nr:MAG: hypothetical protein M1815_003438 [Lichina confinis]